MKLALILEKSIPIINYQREQVIEKWGVDLNNIKKVDSISEIVGNSLFGTPPLTLIHLETPDEIKSIIADLEKLVKTSNLKNIIHTGLILTSNANRNSTKKLEKIVQDSGGLVIAAKVGTKEITLTEELINTVNFSRETRAFFVDYIGNDYDKALPIISSVNKLSSENQSKITIEDLYIRLPQPKGSIPPWEIERPLFSGNANVTIETYRRIVKSSDALLVQAVLRNKVHLMHQVMFLKENNPTLGLPQISAILKVPNNYPLKLALQNGQRYGLKKIQKLLELLVESDRAIKGYSGAPRDALMETMLISFITVLKNN